MRMPEKLYVGHLVFSVKLGDPVLMAEAKAHGILDDIRLTITLNGELDPRLLAETALHEAGHSLYTAYAFGSEPLDEEQLVSRISGPLLLLMQQNPEFFEWINWLAAGRPVSPIECPYAAAVKDETPF